MLRNGRVSGTAIPREESNASLARLMVGSELKQCHAGTARAGRDPPRADRSVAGDRGPVWHHACGRSICGCAAARSSASPGSPATARRNCWRRSRARRSCAQRGSGAPVRPGRRRDCDPAQRRSLGLRFVPEERLGRGAVPGDESRGQLRAHRRQRRAGAPRPGAAPRGARLRPRDHRANSP